MLLKKNKVYRDLVFILLVFNALFVVIGYGFAAASKNLGTEINTFKTERFLLLSFSYLFLIRRKKMYVNVIQIVSLLFLFFFSCFFSDNLLHSLNRVFTFVFPFVYVYLSIGTLLHKYDMQDIIKSLLISFICIYSIPILYTLIFSGKQIFTSFDIYGGYIGSSSFGYIPNNLGWSSVLIIAAIMDLFNHYQTGKLLQYIFIGLLIFSFYVLIISGTRSAWIVMLSIILFFIASCKRKHYFRQHKKWILLLVFFVVIIFVFQQRADSSLQNRLAYTTQQIDDSNEGRMIMLINSIHTIKSNKILLITGLGMFNQDYVSSLNTNLSTLHNSYLEILVGAGIVTLLLFMFLFTYKPLVKSLSQNYFIILPVVILPFFESNLTGGQFLFFPWFITALYFNGIKK
jgi:O-antigen ligase